MPAWTPTEDARLRKLIVEGWSASAIGERLARGKDAVRNRAARLGLFLSRAGQFAPREAASEPAPVISVPPFAPQLGIRAYRVSIPVETGWEPRHVEVSLPLISAFQAREDSRL